MDIVIAGAGRVGYRLASTLSLKNNVYIIDKNKEALSRLTESIDILPIHGDIEDPDTYSKIKDRSFDIFIAVTDNDEANILSTLIATDKIDVATKIIRLRNPYFAKSTIAERLGISEAVFPFIATADSIELLFTYPKANNVKKIPFTDYLLVSVEALGAKVERFEEIVSAYVAPIGVERNKELLLPTGKIQEGDLIYLFGHPEAIKESCALIDTQSQQTIKRVAIFGASLLGIEIARKLLGRVELKVVEEDPDLCKKASETLQEKATIINSKYIEHTVYEEENLRHADMLITTSSDDEDNIIKCLEAKEHGIRRTIAINNNPEYYDLMHKLHIVPIRGPKMHAYYSILEKIASSAIISEKHYCGGRGSLFVRKIFEGSLLIGKKIKPPRFPALLFLLREELIPITEPTTLRQGDIITIFTDTRYEEEAKRWIYNL